jgi:hypothetical protein
VKRLRPEEGQKAGNAEGEEKQLFLFSGRQTRGFIALADFFMKHYMLSNPDIFQGSGYGQSPWTINPAAKDDFGHSSDQILQDAVQH